MKQYVLENKVMIKGKIYEIKFDFSDEGNEYVKWHNFYVDHDEIENRYELQICQEVNQEPYFSIGIYSCVDGWIEREWYDLDDYLKDTRSTIDKIKSYLIKKSDELIGRNKGV